MVETGDLRKILSQNIRNARSSLHISQAKLAESAGISFSHMLDIEYCKSWVSEKTLAGIADALSMEPYELLIPEKTEKNGKSKRNNTNLQKTAELIKEKKRELRKTTGEAMDSLILEIIKLNGN
ncbi:MAG: helix-turn-helix domain-containing protein [Treponema sp.]|nr:helix-turn-helix domain-containing protein [Treponema sp.]